MSALTFREQAAIAWLADVAKVDDELALRAAKVADRLARACCVSWGHVGDPGSPSDFKIECDRCGQPFSRDDVAKCDLNEKLLDYQDKVGP